MNLFILVVKPHKGRWWMPWYGMTMKDVATCDKPRGGGNQPLSRGFPNGATQSDGRSDYHNLNKIGL